MIRLSFGEKWAECFDPLPARIKKAVDEQAILIVTNPDEEQHARRLYSRFRSHRMIADNGICDLTISFQYLRETETVELLWVSVLESQGPH